VREQGRTKVISYRRASKRQQPGHHDVTAADVDLENGVWVFDQHKKKTGKPRVIYLTPTMIDLTRPHV